MSPSAALHLRVFVSSPGDVGDERAMARQVIEQLPYDPLLRGRLTTEVVAWDKPGSSTPMLAGLTPQEAVNLGLPKPSECDVVLVIFWSRMGTPLPDPFAKPDGTQYLSGTEWEFEDALAGPRAQEVLVYRRLEPVLLELGAEDYAERNEQFQRVQKFFAGFRQADGALVRGWNGYETPGEFRELIEQHLRRVIRWRLGDAATVTAVRPDEPTRQGPPFPGLRALAEDDAPMFFGRARDTDLLLKMLRETCRFLAVWGASGSGKSSLIGAGLLPRLKLNALPGSKEWRTIRFTPGETAGDPIAAVAARLAAHAPAGQSLSPAEIAARLTGSDDGLTGLLRALLAGRADWAELLLFGDQFEELFTVTPRERVAPFLEMLGRLAEQERVRVVVALRADFLPRCAEWPGLMDLIQRGSYALAPPGPGQLYEMITRPAARAGLEFEDGLPEQILEETGDHPGGLPLMAFALQELHRTCAPQPRLTWEAFRVTGGIRGAIARRADAVFDGLDAAAQAALPGVFRALVDVRTDGVVTRRRLELDRLAEDAAARRLVEALTGARLLVQGQTDSGPAFVEVAHEAVVQGWSRLSRWLAENREFLFWRHRFAAALAEWQRVARDEGALLRGAALTEAVRWFESGPTDFGVDGREFIQASQAHARVLEGLAAEARRKREQEALRLISEAYRYLYSDPATAVLLALRAGETHATREAEAARVEALGVLRRRHQVQVDDARQWGHGVAWIAPTYFAGKISAQLSRDGKYAVLAAARADNDAYLLNYETLKLTRLEPPGRRDPVKRRLEHLGFSSSGRKIYLSRQFNVEIYSAEGVFEREFYLNSTKYPINLVDAVQDDRLLIAADTTGSVFAVDPVTEKAVGTITWWIKEPMVLLAASPSGRWTAMVHQAGTACVWRVGDFQRQATQRLPQKRTVGATFKSTVHEDILLTSNRDGFVTLWRLEADGPVRFRDFRHDSPITHASFSETGDRVLTITEDRITRVWDADTAELRQTFGDPEAMDWVAIRGSTPVPLAWPASTEAPADDVPADRVPPGQRVDLDGETWVLTEGEYFSKGPAYRLDGDRATPFTGPTGGVLSILRFDGHVWLLTGGFLTEGSVLRVDGDAVVSLADLCGSVAGMEVVDGRLWLMASKGAFRISHDVIERMVPEGVRATGSRMIDGALWLLTAAGGYRVERDVAVRITDTQEILDIRKIGGEVWVFIGSKGLMGNIGPVYRIADYRVIAVADDYQKAYFVEAIDGKFWIGTDDGLRVIDGPGTQRVAGLSGNVTSLQRRAGHLYALADGRAWLIDGGRATAVVLADADAKVERVVECEGRVWLLTTMMVFANNVGIPRAHDAYLVAGDVARAVRTDDHGVREIVQVADDVWLLTVNGPAYRMRGEAAEPFPRADSAVYSVARVGGDVWLDATDGAYRLRGNRAKRIPDRPLADVTIEEREGQVFIRTPQQTFRVQHDHATELPPSAPPTS